jgi:hypothetical protein
MKKRKKTHPTEEVAAPLRGVRLPGREEGALNLVVAEKRKWLPRVVMKTCANTVHLTLTEHLPANSLKRAQSTILGMSILTRRLS